MKNSMIYVVKMGRLGIPTPHLNSSAIPLFSMVVQINNQQVAPKARSIFMNSQKLEIKAVVHILL